MRVSDLDRSVRFYRDVFHCHVALREPDAALLLAPDGFQIYLNSKGQTRRHGVGPGGVQYLMWATDSEAELIGSGSVCSPTIRQPTPTSRTG